MAWNNVTHFVGDWLKNVFETMLDSNNLSPGPPQQTSFSEDYINFEEIPISWLWSTARGQWWCKKQFTITLVCQRAKMQDLGWWVPVEVWFEVFISTYHSFIMCVTALLHFSKFTGHVMFNVRRDLMEKHYWYFICWDKTWQYLMHMLCMHCCIHALFYIFSV